jgi:DNA-binding beta-propeller fold protein YncE
VDTTTNRVTDDAIPLGDKAGAAMLTRDGSRIYVATGDNGAVTAVDTSTGKQTGKPITVGREVQSMAVSPDGSTLFAVWEATDTTGPSDRLTIFDTATGATRGDPIILGTGPHLAVTVSGDGSRAYAANFFDQSVTVVDTRSGAAIGTPVPVGSAPGVIALSPDDQRLYVTLPSAGKLVTFSVADPAHVTSIGLTPP